MDLGAFHLFYTADCPDSKDVAMATKFWPK